MTPVFTAEEEEVEDWRPLAFLMTWNLCPQHSRVFPRRASSSSSLCVLKWDLIPSKRTTNILEKNNELREYLARREEHTLSNIREQGNPSKPGVHGGLY